jgi:hypothetical protein
MEVLLNGGLRRWTHLIWLLKLTADQQQNDQELLQIRRPFKHQRSKDTA